MPSFGAVFCYIGANLMRDRILRIGLAAVLIAALAAPALARSSGHSYSSSSSSHSSAKNAGSPVNPSSHSVRGYTRKDGTYVAPHRATDPNRTRNDNYSTKGNVNPYTGKSGTKPRDAE